MYPGQVKKNTFLQRCYPLKLKKMPTKYIIWALKNH